MPLTDVALRQARPRPKAYKLSDSGGLYVSVMPGGSKLWRLKYRLGGKEKLLSFGAYPAVSLLEARAAREAAKAALRRNSDPAESRRTERRDLVVASAETFGLLAAEFIVKLEGERKAAPTLAKARWILEDLAAPIKNRPISQITTTEVLSTLRRIEAKGAYESARRCRSSISRVFRYAIVTGRAKTDPTIGLAGALVSAPVQHRAAITKPGDFGKLLRAIDDLDGSTVVRSAMQIMALCFPRPGELRYAEWVDIDLHQSIWSVPPERMKMRLPHKLPLAPQAIAIFRRLHKVTGQGRLVFPGLRSAARPISEGTLNAALRRLGYSTDEMSPHGFRTSASTLLNESGLWHPDAIERALAHQDANSVRRAYARGEYWDERKRMADWWADNLDRLKIGKTMSPKLATPKPEAPRSRVARSSALAKSSQPSLFD